jgi:hypothetical protein
VLASHTKPYRAQRALLSTALSLPLVLASLPLASSVAASPGASRSRVVASVAATSGASSDRSSIAAPPPSDRASRSATGTTSAHAESAIAAETMS